MSCLDDSRVDYDFASWVDLLIARAAQLHDSLMYRFVADGDEDVYELTYGEMDRRCRAIAVELRKVAQPGDRALLLHPPGLEYVVAFYACLYAGVVAVPAYPPRARRGLGRLASIVADAQPAIVLSTSTLSRQLTQGDSQRGQLDTLPWLATDTVAEELGEDWEPPTLDSDSLAMLQYTSGSTSDPKGVMLTHGVLLHNSSVIRSHFGTDQDERGVIWLPPYHDMGLIGGILQPAYTAGNATLMPPVAALQNPLRWLRWISKTRGTTSGGPNFAYDLCVEKIRPEDRETLDLSSWRVAFSGAEPINPATLERFAKTFEPLGFNPDAFYPCYGLAESALIVTGGEWNEAPHSATFDAEQIRQGHARAANADDPNSAAQTLVGCGQPADDTQVVIVDPETRQKCAAHEIGEIWVQGPSVAAGYWQRPDKTAEVFEARLADDPQAGCFLRTGDLGFFARGELFITGRIKNVLILRGRNYYPQDIERTVESSHHWIRPHATAAFTVQQHDAQELVIATELQRTALRRCNADTLAEVQRAVRSAVSKSHQLRVDRIVLLKPGGIPKTSSGKIQHFECRERYLSSQLPEFSLECATHPVTAAVGREPGESYRAVDCDTPRWITASGDIAEPDRTEAAQHYVRQLLVELVSPDAHTLSIDEPVASLGVDSLTAVEVINRAEKDLGVRLPIEAVLEEATCRSLAEELLAASPVEELVSRETPPTTGPTRYPLSFGQQALWFIDQSASEKSAYNIPVAARLTGPVDQGRLRSAFAELVRRHASLRATFHAIDGRPLQQINPEPVFDFQASDLRTTSAADLRQRLDWEARQPFDLATGPLLRVRLFRRSDTSYVLMLVVHHIAVDFWSFQVLIRELSALYADGDQADLPAPAVEYADFVHWQADRLTSDVGQRQWEYWQKQLEGDFPVLELPYDRPRSKVQTFRGSEFEFAVDADLLGRIEELARRRRTTPFAVLMATYQILVGRYARQDDVIVGSPLAARTRTEFGELVGYCTNPLPLRARIKSEAPFLDLLADVTQSIRGALENQDFPVSQLVARLRPARDAGQSSLFQTLFVLNRAHRLAGSGTPLAGNGQRMSFDLGGLAAEQIRLPHQFAMFDLVLMGLQTGDGLALSFQYNADLFDPATVAGMAANYQQLLRSILDNPAQAVSDLNWLDADRQASLLALSATPTRGRNRLGCVHEQFAFQAARAPDAIALCAGDETWSYGQLDRAADRLAAHLQQLGVGPDSPVALCTNRGPGQIAAVLGIMKAGGAYVPLDPNSPTERLAFQIEDAMPEVVLADAANLPRFAPCRPQVIGLEELLAKPPQPHQFRPAAGTGNLAYIMYTSGSTGRPKGVEIEHAALAHYTATAAEAFGLGPHDRVLQFASLAFDTAAEEIFPALTCGATLVLRNDQMLGSAKEFLTTCGNWAITVIDLPTAFWHQLVSQMDEEKAGIPESLRLVILGGERAQREAWHTWRQLVGDRVRLLNTYGPTEGTIVSTMWDATTDDAPGCEIPIGRPVPGTLALVLDAQGRLVPQGLPGELHLGGSQLARGYRNRRELTRHRFIENPNIATGSDEPSIDRLYKTGDLVRYLPCGNLEFLGRTDDQVKIRGFRIEPSEIASVLMRHAEVADAAVVATGEKGSRQRLVAFYTAEEHPPTAESLRDHVRRHLPDYMTPASFVCLDAMPYTTSGKVDRRRLPIDRAAASQADRPYIAPRTPLEEKIAQVWCDVLQVPRVGVDENFFDLGGESLLAMQLAAQASNCEIPLSTQLILQHQTVAAQAAALDQHQKPTCSERVVPLQTSGSAVPLFLIHPTGGMVLPYYHLAHHLGSDQPVFALQAQGVADGRTPHDRVEAMAEEYIAAMRKVQPAGPYRLAGWSLGGLVAYEMARQLAQQDAEVSHLMLFDARPSGETDADQQAWEMLSIAFPALQLIPIDEFQQLPRAAQIAYFAEQAVAAQLLPSEIAASQAERMFAVFEAHVAAGRAYRPKQYASRVDLYTARQRTDGGGFDWLSVAHSLHEQMVPGNHWTMLREPNVHSLAVRLAERLQD